jgi:ABC-type uncharacterized transport system substrate-binding protein
MQAVANANQTRGVRHVFAVVSDPFSAGVGISREDPLQHPPYMVGYGTMQPVAASLQLARRMFPDLRLLGNVWNPAEANSEATTRLAREACKELGIELLEANVDSTAAVKEAAGSLVARGVQALWVGGDVTVLTAIDSIVAVAREARIPVVSTIPGCTTNGALFDLGANYYEVGRLGGTLAAKVLNGADPATIPVENVLPERLVINKDALKDLKDPWHIPEDVLQKAEVLGGRREIAQVTDTPRAGGAERIAAPLTKTWRVDLLEYVNVADVEDIEKGIGAGFREARLVEGRDYELRIRNAQGDMPTLSALVDAALTDGTDLLMTLSTPTLQAALQRARDVPIVFTFVADAVAAGAGRSNDDHLPNVTGVPTTSAYAELVSVLKEVLPAARRCGTLFVPAEVNTVYNKERLTEEAREAGIEVVTMAVNTSTEVADAALALCNLDLDALCQIGGNLTTTAFGAIYQAAQRAHLPVFGFLTSNATDGAVVVVARDYFDGGREAALMAARVMRGESPASIPFQPLRTTRLVVNLDAARSLGLTIPPAVVARAAQVIDRND